MRELRPDQRFERFILGVEKNRAPGCRLARNSGGTWLEKGDSVGHPFFHFQMKHSVKDRVTFAFKDWVTCADEASMLSLQPIFVLGCGEATSFGRNVVYAFEDDTSSDNIEVWSSKTKTIKEFHSRIVFWNDIKLLFNHKPPEPALSEIDKTILDELKKVESATVMDLAHTLNKSRGAVQRSLYRALYCGYAFERKGAWFGQSST